MSYLMRTIVHFGLWELAVLALLRERAMHPYEMQRLLRERHKDELLVLKRGSLYHAIRRLVRSGLIKAIKVGRTGSRPERTTYRITPEGKQELIRWLRQMVAIPKHESSEFMASMSFLVYLEPGDASSQLDVRAGHLQKEIGELREVINLLVARITRINLLESEYLLAMREAELEWIRGLGKELRSGELKWDLEQILRQIRAAKRKRKR
jgi:DNA-binding PadR family transcriptional regulator